jgi:hypothetical protein
MVTLATWPLFASPLAAQQASDLDCVDCVSAQEVEDGSLRSRDFAPDSINASTLAPALRERVFHMPGYEVKGWQILDGTITGADIAPDLLESLRNPQAEVIQVDCAAGGNVQHTLNGLPLYNTQPYTIELLSDCSEGFRVTSRNNITVDGQGATIAGGVGVLRGTDVNIYSMTVAPDEEGSCGMSATFSEGVIFADITVRDCPYNGIVVDASEISVFDVLVTGSGESGLYATRDSKLTMEFVSFSANGYSGAHLRDGSSLYADLADFSGNGQAGPPTEFLPEPAGILLQGSSASLSATYLVDNLGAQARLETGSSLRSNSKWDFMVIMTYGYTTARQYPWSEEQFGRHAFALSGGSEMELHGAFVSGDIHVTEDSSYSQTSKRWDSYLPHDDRYEGDVFADHRSYVGFDDFVDFNAVLTCDGATQAYCKHPPLPVPELTASN